VPTAANGGVVIGRLSKPVYLVRLTVNGVTTYGKPGSPRKDPDVWTDDIAKAAVWLRRQDASASIRERRKGEVMEMQAVLVPDGMLAVVLPTDDPVLADYLDHTGYAAVASALRGEA
jgi:hypothetical protein